MTGGDKDCLQTEPRRPPASTPSRAGTRHEPARKPRALQAPLPRRSPGGPPPVGLPEHAASQWCRGQRPCPERSLGSTSPPNAPHPPVSTAPPSLDHRATSHQVCGLSRPAPCTQSWAWKFPPCLSRDLAALLFLVLNDAPCLDGARFTPWSPPEGLLAGLQAVALARFRVDIHVSCSSRRMLRGVVAGSSGHFVRKHQTGFQPGCAIPRPHQPRTEFPLLASIR